MLLLWAVLDPRRLAAGSSMIPLLSSWFKVYLPGIKKNR
jgi:hypothetical protein